MDAIISQWDCAALRYMQDQERSEYVHCNKALVQARFPGFSGERVLDLGCGYGCYTITESSIRHSMTAPGFTMPTDTPTQRGWTAI